MKYRHCAECGRRIDFQEVRCCKHKTEIEESDVFGLKLEEVRSS